MKLIMNETLQDKQQISDEFLANNTIVNKANIKPRLIYEFTQTAFENTFMYM